MVNLILNDVTVRFLPLVASQDPPCGPTGGLQLSLLTAKVGPAENLLGGRGLLEPSLDVGGGGIIFRSF